MSTNKGSSIGMMIVRLVVFVEAVALVVDGRLIFRWKGFEEEPQKDLLLQQQQPPTVDSTKVLRRRHTLDDGRVESKSAEIQRRLHQASLVASPEITRERWTRILNRYLHEHRTSDLNGEKLWAIIAGNLQPKRANPFAKSSAASPSSSTGSKSRNSVGQKLKLWLR